MQAQDAALEKQGQALRHAGVGPPERTDVLAVGTAFEDRPLVEMQVKTATGATERPNGQSVGAAEAGQGLLRRLVGAARLARVDRVRGP